MNREYIEIPGVEYDRDIGIRGLDITIVFKRAGRRVRLKKLNVVGYLHDRRLVKKK